MKQEEGQVNYAEFGYIGDENISIPVQDYYKFKEVVDQELAKNTTHSFPEKYIYVDQEGKTVKKVTDANRDLVKKIVDIDATMSAKPTITRTPLGMQLLEIKLSMNRVHKEMVESGVAKHIPTLQKEEEERKKALMSAPLVDDEQPTPKMEVVK